MPLGPLFLILARAPKLKAKRPRNNETYFGHNVRQRSRGVVRTVTAASPRICHFVILSHSQSDSRGGSPTARNAQLHPPLFLAILNYGAEIRFE